MNILGNSINDKLNDSMRDLITSMLWRVPDDDASIAFRNYIWRTFRTMRVSTGAVIPLIPLRSTLRDINECIR